jgi:histone H3/H4
MADDNFNISDLTAADLQTETKTRKKPTKGVLKADVNFNTYISRVFAEIDTKSERKISSILKGQLNSLLNHIARAAGQQANAITDQAGRTIITEQIMLSTVANMFGGKNFGESAKKYKLHVYQNPVEPGDKKVKAEERCDLVIPPARMTQYLKLGGYSTKKRERKDNPEKETVVKHLHGKSAGIYVKIILAEFLEYILRGLLTLAVHNQDKKLSKIKTLTIDHISKVLNYKKNSGVEESLTSKDLQFIKRMNDLLCKLKIQFTMASANEDDVIKPAIKRNAADADRSKPGKVAGQKVRQMQKLKGNRVITHMAPLHRAIKCQLGMHDGPQNVSRSAVTVLHLFLERELVDFLMDANELAKHAGRIGMNHTDVDLARKHLRSQCVA